MRCWPVVAYPRVRFCAPVRGGAFAPRPRQSRKSKRSLARDYHVAALAVGDATAALAALGLVPAAFSKAIGAEMQRPMAVVIVGGTVSAAVLTLVVLPAVYPYVSGLRLPFGGSDPHRDVRPPNAKRRVGSDA